MWKIEEMTGYKPKTTLWQDFTLTEGLGEDKLWELFEDSLADYRNNVEYLTELAMVLNWKIWEWYEKDEKLARVYDELWKRCDMYCMDNLKGAKLQYYLKTTD